MSKLRVGFSTIFYPVAIGKFFWSALLERDDLEVVSCGPFTGTWIPWNGSMELPEKYAEEPDIPLSRHLISARSMNPNFLYAKPELKDIDIWIQADSTFYFTERPPCKTNVHIAVDPHVISYSYQRTKADYFFNMQKFYSEPDDIYLPYCASQYHHY